MTAQLRILARSELGALTKVHAECFPADPWNVRDFMELLTIAGASGRIAVSQTNGIEAFMLDLIGPEDAEILTIGVAPQARRRGLARTLIGDVARRARQKGARRVLLEVAADNEPAIALYVSSGFILLGERPRYYRRREGDVDAFVFGKYLSPMPYPS
jgi:[ribosomal protein S18]-alanine N-acetyltransferase